MKIRVDDFVGGAKYIISSDTEAERVLLTACVSDDNHLQEGDTEIDFVLTLPVSN